jgi:uncharacterized delta-60 repeat protein
MRGRALFAALVASFVFLATAVAKPGKVVLPAGSDVSATDVATQRDGKVVVAGFSSDEGNGFVWRLRENGKIDRGFAEEGVATIDSGGNERLFAVEIQRNGRILVAGSTNVGGNAAIYRLRKDGTPDSSFDTDGAMGIDSGGFEELSDIALRPDGRIVVVGGSSLSTQTVVYQVEENGGNGAINDGLDESFAGDGAFAIDTGAGDIGYAVALQRDGKLVVAGASSIGARAVVHRIRADGSGLDTGFGQGGTVPLSGPTMGQAFAYDVAVQRDRKLLVAGRTGGDGVDAAVWRLRKGGAPDQGFAGDGRRPVNLGKASAAFDLRLLGKGRSLVTGIAEVGAGADAFVAKLKESGAFDRRFKRRGKRFLRGPANDAGNAIDVDRDGRIVVAGSPENAGEGFVVRLKKNGRTDKKFNR